MIRTDRRLRLSLALTGCLLVFIWGNSLLPGELSGALSDWVHDLLTRLFGDGETRQGSGLLRKIAHFSEFAALGACLSWRSAMLGRKKGLAPVLGIGAACVDETIQRFVPERGPSLWDVALDSFGVLAGITLLYFGHLFYRKKTTDNPVTEEL